MPNSFQEIEDVNEKAPEELKKEVVGEINALRGFMEIVSLFAGNFFITAAASFVSPVNPVDKKLNEN